MTTWPEPPDSTPVDPITSSPKPLRVTQATLIYLLLGGLSFISLIPLLWMISTSLKAKPEVYIFPPTLLPVVIQWQNYYEAWVYPGMQFSRWTFNTVFISVTVLFGTLVTASLCAYGFARIQFPGRDFWFVVTLASVMLPPQVILIPLYILFLQIGWLDTFKPLTIPPWFGGGAINIFLLRQFFLQIPTELEDAALIDGASRWRIWRHIFLPLSAPGLVTVAIFTFQQTWNDFYGPLIYITSQEKYTLAVGLSFFRGVYGEELHYMMAAAFVMTLPMIIVFFLAQRYYIRGIVLSGIKG